MTPIPPEQQLRNAVLEALIKGGLLLLLVYVCYRIFSPFLALMLWALVMAITLHPSHQKLSRRLGGKQGLAATLMVLLGVLLLLVPSALLVGSMADTLKDVATGQWQVPTPSAKVADWPWVGDKLYAVWQQAATDLPSLLQQKAPELGSILKTLLSTAASMGGSLLSFLLSFVIAGIMLAFSAPGAAAMGRIADRLLDPIRGPGFIQLSSRTIQAVAMGILGVAVIQALLIGLLMMLAGVPLAGLLALLVLIFGIAQIPASLVTIPVILWLWMGGEHGTLSAVIFTVLLVVGGMVDNVLKPMMLGRGVEAPMPVVLLGALGGMVNGGILGMFLGATLLAMGYQLFMSWVQQPATAPTQADELPPQG
ncbi:AI-2E family transporter [Pseudaeromonas sp. ZJS20]|uniref:AI-2E family transporter n=1 Tax=Pseudaeromonas aegiceratis TaxID=3153928 RepID=UPI00390CB01E